MMFYLSCTILTNEAPLAAIFYILFLGHKLFDQFQIV